MKFKKVNSWLTLTANMGVLIGLILLIAELNQTNNQMSSRAQQDRTDSIVQANVELALSESLADIITKMEESGVSSLSASELIRARSWANATINRMRGQYYQYQQGFIDEETNSFMLIRGTNNLRLWKELGTQGTTTELWKVWEARAKINLR